MNSKSQYSSAYLIESRYHKIGGRDWKKRGSKRKKVKGMDWEKGRENENIEEKGREKGDREGEQFEVLIKVCDRQE